MKSTARGLALICRGTLVDYAQRAAAFRSGTRDHDVGQNVDALLAAIEGTPPSVCTRLARKPGGCPSPADADS